jgi:protein phosphatase
VVNVTEVEGLRIASATDVGRRRSENEDALVVWAPADPAEAARRGVLLVVADGMGGANAGEVASRLATEVVLETFRAHDEGEPEDVLKTAIENANDTIHEQAGAQADQRGMGTTCTALVVRGRDLWFGHVGDSRAYIVRSGSAIQLTEDHSLVRELVNRGHLTEEDAKHDPRRNVVTRSVGAADAVQVDAEHVAESLRPGDSLVMCSDGLHGQVSDLELARLVSENDPEDACRGLIDLANEHGGPDNITVIVARAAGVNGEGGSQAGTKLARKSPDSLAAWIRSWWSRRS